MRKILLAAAFSVAMFAVLYFKIGLNITMLRYFVLLAFLSVLSAEDIRTKTISDGTIVLMLIVGVAVIGMSFSMQAFIESAVAGIGTGVVMLVVCFLSKNQVGLGDVKLLAATAVYVGIAPILTIVFYSLFYAMLFGLYLIFVKNEKKEAEIPFAPFILLGVMSLIFFI